MVNSCHWLCVLSNILTVKWLWGVHLHRKIVCTCMLLCKCVSQCMGLLYTYVSAWVTPCKTNIPTHSCPGRRSDAWEVRGSVIGWPLKALLRFQTLGTGTFSTLLLLSTQTHTHRTWLASTQRPKTQTISSPQQRATTSNWFQCRATHLPIWDLGRFETRETSKERIHSRGFLEQTMEPWYP